jgi:DNA-binding response OmpR family regulator
MGHSKAGLSGLGGRKMIVSARPVRGILVEGDLRTREDLKDYLQKVMRYETQVVNDPYHLIAVCETAPHHPTVLLLDMEWNRIEGTDLVREIRKRASWISILGMTWNQATLCNHPIIRQESIALIPKPLSPMHLHRSLGATLAADGWLPFGRATSPRLRDLVPIHLSGAAA